MKLYTKQNCPNCLLAKKFLMIKGLYSRFEVIEDAETIQIAAEKAGVKSLPFAEIDGEFYTYGTLREWAITTSKGILTKEE